MPITSEIIVNYRVRNNSAARESLTVRLPLNSKGETFGVEKFLWFVKIFTYRGDIIANHL